MAMESVSSTNTTVQAPPQNRETQRAQEQNEARRAERAEPTPPPQEEKPAARPVVNGEGQVTGTRVNTTA